jgi:hypothetical protein
MAIKKKVTYSVSYVAGTDTLTTQLNSLLQDIVTLILSQNTGLQILDTITIGSERWTGAPLYDTRPSNLMASDYNNRHYESDVIFIGTDEDNVCLSFGFFQGELVVAMNMTPKVEAEYAAIWSSTYRLNTLPFYATGKQSRWFDTEGKNPGNYSIPYRIINNAISISILYWNTEYSRGYSFINGSGESDGMDLVIFPTDEGGGQTGIGAAIWGWGRINEYRATYRSAITVFDFAENLSEHKPSALPNGNSNVFPAASMQDKVICNGYIDSRVWSNSRNNETYNRYNNFFAAWHTLGAGNYQVLGFGNRAQAMGIAWTVAEYFSADEINKNVIPSTALTNSGTILASAYNLPHLIAGQAYVRKMRIPGWNPECKGEIYLLWAPVLTAYQSGDIVEVGSKSYAIITEGAVAWAARVS